MRGKKDMEETGSNFKDKKVVLYTGVHQKPMKGYEEASRNPNGGK